MWNFQTKYPFKSYKKVIIGGAICLFLVAIASILIINSNQKIQAKGENSKIITVFDRGQRKSFISSAQTVEQALKEQNFQISAADNIEPALNTSLTGTDYNINIYRASAYLIRDGEQKIRVLTANKTPNSIARAAGVNLLEEDLVDFEQTDDFLEDGSTAILNIVRAKVIRVKFFGQEQEFRTQAKTISDFLKGKKITLDEKIWVSKDQRSAISNGDYFEIARNGKQTIQVEEDIDFEIQKIENGEKEVGFKEIKEAGEKGKKTVVYEIDFQNGKELSRQKISEVQTKSAKKQVEIVGAKVRAVAYTGGGNKDTWLAASGIPQEYWGYVDAIVTKESGWNPNATNRSSGACGLAQALPCSKVKGEGGGYNPVTSLQWMNSYVNGRYGGWAGAWSFWQKNRWY